MTMHMFKLADLRSGEVVATIEMEMTLLHEVIDRESGTLRELKHGANYTVEPLDRKEPLLGLLRGIRQRYLEFQKPCESLLGTMEKADGIVRSVGLLFKEISYIKVKSRADLQALVSPAGHADHEFEKGTYSILDGVCDELVAEIDVTIERSVEAFKEAAGHEHGEHCDH